MTMFHIFAWAIVIAYFATGEILYGITGVADGWFVVIGYFIAWPAVLSIGMTVGRRP